MKVCPAPGTDRRLEPLHVPVPRTWGCPAMTEKQTVNRRDFLGSAGAATGAVVAAGTFAHPAIGKVKGANDRLNFAILGPGGRAQAHIGVLLAMEDEGKPVDIIA